MSSGADGIPMRNVGIFAHVDAGKTTTTEHILYESGRIRALGSVDTGTAQTDWLDVERERGISVRSATTAFTWQGTYMNLVDTPGHVDFLSEVERSLRVMDGAVLIVSAVEGVQSQTEMIWHALRSLGIPTILYINKMDRVGADPTRVLAELHRQLTPLAIPVQTPLGAGGRFIVEGRLPVATSLDYPVKLSAMSGGRGVIASAFGGYEPCPPDVRAERKRRGVNPLDQAKYILAVRKALSM